MSHFVKKDYIDKAFTIHFATINIKELSRDLDKDIKFTIHFATINMWI